MILHRSIQLMQVIYTLPFKAGFNRRICGSTTLVVSLFWPSSLEGIQTFQSKFYRIISFIITTWGKIE